MDFKEATFQRDELVKRLEKMLPKRALEELVMKTVEFRAKRLSQYEYYEHILKNANIVNIDMEDYPRLREYIVYISLYHAIDKLAVMAEITSLEDTIKGILFQDDIQKELSVLSKNLVLTKNIFDIELTKEDYRYYRENRSSFRARNFTAFIDREAPKYKIDARPDKGIERLDDHRESIEKFFAVSFDRDLAFMKNIRFKEQAEGIEAAVIVTGGFHTENLSELFRKEGISYISIIPNFTNEKGYECPYFKILAGGETDIEKTVDSAFSALQVPSMLTELGIEAGGEREVNRFKLSARIAEAMIRGNSFIIKTPFELVTFRMENGKVVYDVEKPADLASASCDVVVSDVGPLNYQAQEEVVDEPLKEAYDEGRYKSVFGEPGKDLDKVVDYIRNVLGLGEVADRLVVLQRAGRVNLVWGRPGEPLGSFKGHAGRMGIHINNDLAKTPGQIQAVLIHEAMAYFFQLGHDFNENVMIAYAKGSGARDTADLRRALSGAEMRPVAERTREERERVGEDYAEPVGVAAFSLTGFLLRAQTSAEPVQAMIAQARDLYNRGMVQDAVSLAAAAVNFIRDQFEDVDDPDIFGAIRAFKDFEKNVPMQVLLGVLDTNYDAFRSLWERFDTGRAQDYGRDVLKTRIENEDMPDYVRVRALENENFMKLCREMFGDAVAAEYLESLPKWGDAAYDVAGIKDIEKSDIPSKQNAIRAQREKRIWVKDKRQSYDMGVVNGDPKNDNGLFSGEAFEEAVRRVLEGGRDARSRWESPDPENAMPRQFDFDRFWEISEMPWADLVYNVYVLLVQQNVIFGRFIEASDTGNKIKSMRRTLEMFMEEGIANEIIGRTEAERDEIIKLAIRFESAWNQGNAAEGRQVVFDTEDLVHRRFADMTERLYLAFAEAIDYLRTQSGPVAPDEILRRIAESMHLRDLSGMGRIGANELGWIFDEFLNEEMLEKLRTAGKWEDAAGRHAAELQNIFMAKLAKFSVFGMEGIKKSEFRARHKGPGGAIERCYNDLTTALRTGAVSSIPDFFDNESNIEDKYGLRKGEARLLSHWVSILLRGEIAKAGEMPTEPVKKAMTPLARLGVGAFTMGGMNVICDEKQFLEDAKMLRERLRGKEKDPDETRKVLADFVQERYTAMQGADAAGRARERAVRFLNGIDDVYMAQTARFITDLADEKPDALKELRKLTTKTKLSEKGYMVPHECVFKVPVLSAEETIFKFEIDSSANLDELSGKLFRRGIGGRVVAIDDARAYLSELNARQGGKYVVIRRFGEVRALAGGGEATFMSLVFPNGEILEVPALLYTDLDTGKKTPLSGAFKKADRNERLKGTLEGIKALLGGRIIDTDVIEGLSSALDGKNVFIVRQERWDTSQMKDGQEVFREAAKGTRPRDVLDSAEANINDLMKMKMQIASLRATALGVTAEGTRFYDARSLLDVDGELRPILALEMYRVAAAAADPNYDPNEEVTELMLKDFMEAIGKNQAIVAFKDGKLTGVLTFSERGIAVEVVRFGVSPQAGDDSVISNIRTLLMDQAMDLLLRRSVDVVQSVMLTPTLANLEFYQDYFQNRIGQGDLRDMESEVRERQYVVRLRPQVTGEGLIAGGVYRRNRAKAREKVEELRTEPGAAAVKPVTDRCASLLKDKWAAVEAALKRRGVPQDQIDRARQALESPMTMFGFFNALVENADDYILGQDNALAVNIVEFLAGKGDLLDEYILHEALERIDDKFLDHEEAIEITSGVFAGRPRFVKGGAVRPGETPLGKALRDFINTEAGEKEAVSRVQEAISQDVRAEAEVPNPKKRVASVFKGHKGTRFKELSGVYKDKSEAGTKAMGKTRSSYEVNVSEEGFTDAETIANMGETGARAFAMMRGEDNRLSDEDKGGHITLFQPTKDSSGRDLDRGPTQNAIWESFKEEAARRRVAVNDDSIISRTDSVITIRTEDGSVYNLIFFSDDYTDFSTEEGKEAYPDPVKRQGISRTCAFFEESKTAESVDSMRYAMGQVKRYLTAIGSSDLLDKISDIKDPAKYFDALYKAGLKIEPINFASIKEYIEMFEKVAVSL
ncbi:MAG: hypothetical protein WBC00_02695 [Candidatus Omnitrophota bacterium]